LVSEDHEARDCAIRHFSNSDNRSTAHLPIDPPRSKIVMR